MWNQLWGGMLWGAPAVPGPGAWWLLLGGLAVLWASRRILRGRSARPLAAVLTLALVAVPIAVWATVTLPHTFSNGTVADADEVNANFAALVAAVEANQARLDEIGQMFLTTSACPAGHTAVEDGYIRLGGSGLTLATQPRTLASPGHGHSAGTLTTALDGSHAHTYGDWHYEDTGFHPNYATPTGDDVGIRRDITRQTQNSPPHTHTVTGEAGNAGGPDGDADVAATGQLEHVLLRLCVLN
jgi:hypothetical protein